MGSTKLNVIYYLSCFVMSSMNINYLSIGISHFSLMYRLWKNQNGKFKWKEANVCPKGFRLITCSSLHSATAKLKFILLGTSCCLPSVSSNWYLWCSDVIKVSSAGLSLGFCCIKVRKLAFKVVSLCVSEREIII